MTRPVLILGSGGHATVLIEALLQSGTVIVGVVDPDPANCGRRILGVEVIGTDEVIDEFPSEEIALINGLGSIALPFKRTEIFLRFRDRGYRFASAIHPSAVIASDAVLGEGVQIMAGSVIQPGCTIGCNAVINTRASVDHDCLIGAHSHLAPGVTLSGGVELGEGVHVGTAATIIQGVRVAEGCLIAAGAVVTRSLPAGAKVRGVPAREFA